MAKREIFYERGNFRVSWPSHDVGAEIASREFPSILEAVAHISELLLKLFYTKSCLSQVRRESLREAEIQRNVAALLSVELKALPLPREVIAPPCV